MPAEREAERRTAQPRTPEFEEFFRATYGSLVRILSVAADDVEDEVQDAFVQAHLHWPKVSSYDDPTAWVRLVAVRRILNRERGRTRKLVAVERLGSSSDSPVEGPHSPDTSELANAVRRLPARQRAAVALFYLCDFPMSEVAKTMGVSVGTVKASLFAARKTLRKHLENDDDT
jgi:RNA polymerase sigma-70 factor (ECF subfamily)